MSHLTLPWNETMAISKEGKTLSVKIGTRIAQLRKAQNITQVQLAEWLEVSQQTINAYEVGHRRMPVSALPTLAHFLGVALDELIAEEPKPAKRGPTPKLQRQMERIQELPKPKQRFVLEVLEAALVQASR